MSIRFADFVGTNQATVKQNKYLKNSTPYKYREPEVLTAQLFFSSFEEDGFTEENSTKVEINHDTDLLQYSVNYTANRFRFDPADKQCILLLKGITAYDENNNALIVNEISSNAIISTNSSYLFVTDDPQFYFEIDSKFTTAKIAISLRYIHFIEDDFFLELGKVYEEMMNNNVFLTNSIEQNNNIYNQKALIHQSVLEGKEHLIQEYKENNVNLKVEIAELQHKLLEQFNINDSLSNEKSHLLDIIKDLQADLATREQFIKSIKKTYWWRITQKMKGFIEKIRGGLKGKRK
jgi:hypothetical protein